MKYYASLSYGKDSLAMLEAIHILGYPLDGILHAEVWATDTIPGELPEMVEFKAKADRFIKQRYGLEVEHVCATNEDGSKKTFNSCFYEKPVRKKASKKAHLEGEIYGWPCLRGRWCTNRLKTQVLNKAAKETYQYVGIAVDELERIDRNIKAGKLLPLVDIGWSEADCMEWCEVNDLVSPIYASSNRGGCWFCPMQSLGDLRKLHSDYPDLWEMMLKWDKDSPVVFQTNGRTVHDYDKRFKAEEAGLVPVDRRFRWKMLDSI